MSNSMIQNNYMMQMNENCYDFSQMMMPHCYQAFNPYLFGYCDGENCKILSDSLFQGSSGNQSFMKINSKVDFQNLNSELSQENQLLMESSLSSDPTTVSKSFIVVREKKNMSSMTLLTSENMGQCDSSSKKSKKRDSNKAKIPQKLIDNRRQEIISSLEKISDDAQIVVHGIPRVYTGSKRGSNFRGVSVNGKKWQVMVMGFGKKRYYGGIKDEYEAAKLYDKYAILTQGVGAKTNFSYTKNQMLEILSENLTFE